jgi:hypothetical protein
LLMVAAKHPEVIMDTHLFAESGEKAAVSRV